MQKLPKPRFNLKAPKAKSETLIFLVFRYRGKKLLYSTGLNIHPKDWDDKLQRPIRKERRKDLWLLYQQIEDLAETCISIYIETDYGSLSIKEFKHRLSGLSGKVDFEKSNEKAKASQKRVEFLEFLGLELAEMKATKMNTDTLRTLRLHTNILKRYAQEEGTFTYEDIDWGFRLRLIDWLTARDIQLSYGNKTLKVLRMFLERAKKKKIHNNSDYKGRGWLIPRTKAKGHIIFLTLQELQALADLDLTSTAEKVRDLFLIGAGTGQRFSDYSKYRPHHFYVSDQGIPIVSVVSQKTHTPAKIPLNIFPWLIPVLEKHDFSSPKISLQKFNLWIKAICIQAGFDSKVLKIEQYMGRKPRVVKKYIPKHQEVASHTCRRSFATNLYKMGYSLAQIMPMTGHSSESQLREYIGLDNEENAENIGLEILKKGGHPISKNDWLRNLNHAQK
ncbi:MAG: tyrosine-type recombinase/integrase [Bacteroidota bacterium]